MKIKCPACNFENKEGAKFCSNCNEPLVTPKISINKENSHTKKEASNNNTENTNIKKIIKKERLRMNKKQMVILALFVPVLLFFISLIIAYYVSVEVVVTPAHYSTPPQLKINKEASPQFQKFVKWLNKLPPTLIPAKTVRYSRPIEWQKTWCIWLLFLAFCCFFEYKLFEDKEIISNKKKKELK